jgi:hypothetical protein
MQHWQDAALSRLFVVLVGLLLTDIFGLAYLNAKFDSGLAPAPFLTFMYLLGFIAGLTSAAVLRRSIMRRAALLLMTIAALAIVMDVAPQFFFWFAVVPSIGALAATLPSAWRTP